MNKSIINPVLIIAILSILSISSMDLFGQTVTERIHIDQFGYLPTATKFAVISDPQQGYNASLFFTPGTTYKIIGSSNGTEYLSGSPVSWNGGQIDPQSGDRGWWFDFSALSTPGEYYILDVDNNVKSHTFTISEDIYDNILIAAGRMFYYNRCNSTKPAQYAGGKWLDFTSFEQDKQARYVNAQNDASLEKDLSGGWYDAGDYNKYVTFAKESIHTLLYAYQENKDAFGDNWNIPESGNGVADVIDEVKWELDWLRRMTNADGSVHIKLGSISYNDNNETPPSLNTDTRYYGPTCTSASINTAGMMAHAAFVFRDINSLGTYASDLESIAISCWEHVEGNLATGNLDLNCDDGTIKSGDADRNSSEQYEDAVLAAIHLLALTGNSKYNDFIRDHIDQVAVMGGWWGGYNVSLSEALLYYTTLTSASADIKTQIINAVTPHVRDDWNGFYGFNDDDLYRAYMPEGDCGWGSNMTRSNYGILNNMMAKYDIYTPSNESFRLKASEQIHFFHGVNPMGMVMLSNMYDYGAEDSADEIYHSWFADGSIYDNALTSARGPAPGFLVGGPNAYYTKTNISPPAGQPALKSYKEFNGFSDVEAAWEITEPAIYYQAAYIRLLASQTTAASTTLPVVLASFDLEEEGADVRVSWTTKSEVNSSAYEVERSEDAEQWDLVETVSAAGNSTETIDYNILDLDPWSEVETLYYRVHMIDLDGQSEYSQVASISRSTSATESMANKDIILSPNPTSGVISVRSPSSEIKTIVVYTMDGRAIEKVLYDTEIIDLTQLPPAIYIIRVETNKGMSTHRVVRMK